MPPNKMERFTQRSRRALSLAQEEATRLKHNYIGTEHLLLGLMLEEGGIAGRVLRELGVEQQKVEELVQELTRATTRVPTTSLDLSPGTKRVLELAVDEARRMTHHYVGTEHLLLGLVRQSDGVAIDVLKRLGISPEEVRRTTRRVLQETPVQPPQTEEADKPINPSLSAESIASLRGEIERRMSAESPQPAAETENQPPNRMERFTQRARRVLSLAQEAAERLKHNYIGTEHLLLGLMREEGGVAGRVLRELGLEQRRVEELVEELTRATARVPSTNLDLSPGTKRVLELAVDEARRMGHHYVGTEHLLIGLVRQSDGVAIDVLKRLGISPEVVRRQTRRVLQEHPVQNPGSATAEVEAATPTRQPSVIRTVIRNTGTQAFEIMQATITRVLDMVEAEKLTTTQAAELLTAVPIQITTTQAFEIIQATIKRILDMVEAEKLTTAQAAELLGGLQSYLAPSAGQKAQLVAQTLKNTHLEKRHLEVVIRNVTTREVVFKGEMVLQDAMNNLDIIVDAIIKNDASWFWTEDVDSNNRIEFRIVGDEP